MSVLIDTQRYQMEMLSGNVIMLENNIRLISISHTYTPWRFPVTVRLSVCLRAKDSVKHGIPYWSFCGWLRGMAGNYPYKRRYPFACVYRTVRASSARRALRLHPYPLSPCYNTTLHRAMLRISYSQPLLSLFCKVQNLDTEGFQLAGSLLQHSDLMRDCDVGKVRIDDLYDLIM